MNSSLSRCPGEKSHIRPVSLHPNTYKQKFRGKLISINHTSYSRQRSAEHRIAAPVDDKESVGEEGDEKEHWGELEAARDAVLGAEDRLASAPEQDDCEDAQQRR